MTPRPAFGVAKTELARVQSLRALFLQEANHQIRYNACHERGWTDSYVLRSDDLEIGYGSIKGREIADRDSLFELYLIPPFRRYARELCRELLIASKARYIECQSNDVLLTPRLFELAENIKADVVLFGHHTTTHHASPGAIVRARRDDDQVFEHTVEPMGDYVLELDGRIVATGGFLLHYNKPFADLYMEVDADHRGAGLGTFLVQEIIKQCYLAGRVPAARTGINNLASRATLTKAGLKECGFMLLGEVRIT